MRRNVIPTICSATGWLSTSKNPIFPIMRNPFPRPPACRASCFYYLQNIRFIPLTTWKPIFPSCSPFPITCRVCFLMNPKKAQPGFLWKKRTLKKVHSSAAKSSQRRRFPPARTFYRRRFLPDLHLFYKKDF